MQFITCRHCWPFHQCPHCADVSHGLFIHALRWEGAAIAAEDPGGDAEVNSFDPTDYGEQGGVNIAEGHGEVSIAEGQGEVNIAEGHGGVSIAETFDPGEGGVSIAKDPGEGGVSEGGVSEGGEEASALAPRHSSG